MTERPQQTMGAAPILEPDSGAAIGKVEGRTQREIVWRRFRRHRLAMASAVVLLVIFAAAIAAPLIAPYGYAEPDFTAINSPPSVAHPMGADTLGRDQLTRILYGGRVSLLSGLSVGVFSTLFGAVVGIVAGFYGRFVDAGAMGFTDFMLVLPLLPFLIVLGSILNFTPLTIAAVLTLFLWVTTARLVRGQVLSLRNREYVQAAQAIGVSGVRIMIRHIFPNVIGVVVVQATLLTALAIGLESSLSYLGVGIQPPTPSWGNLLEDARSTLTQQWWLAVFPLAMIVLTATCVNFLGDGLRDALDPKAVE